MMGTMVNCLKVYPKHGFLNTEYKVRSERKDSFSILFNGQKVFEGDVKAGETKVLPKFKVAGEYDVINNRTNERQKVFVEDALRLGSSDLKHAYVFDDFPYIIFVMKDRIHFYDSSIETYVYTENYLSPNAIEHISGGKLLFSTKHSDGTSLSVFDTDKLNIEHSIEIGELLAHSKDFKTLYVLDKYNSSVCIVRTEDLSFETEYHNVNPEGQDFFHLDNENGLLYIVEDNYIYVIDIDSGNTRRFDKNDVIGVTNTGFIISSVGNEYQYEDLKEDSIGKGRFKYNPLISDFCVDGLAIANADWKPRIIIAKNKKSYTDMSNEFAQECRNKIAKGNESLKFSKKIDWDNIRLSVKFFPSNEGIYVIEDIERSYESIMTYYKQSDRVSNPICERRKIIVWISNLGYETMFSTGVSAFYARDILVKNEKALIEINSSLCLLLKNGEVFAKLNSKNEAVDFIPKKIEVENPVIIDDSKIPTYNIICRSNHKLVCKNNHLYSYYEISNSKWHEIKTISFDEEKHTKAKMSLDGKYLVYSKGGNKYTLYNILEQKEEMVLTGNFVDFDKTGNLLFMEDANGKRVDGRELKVYNPITFQWKKSNAQYYAFISPDGKLYAKTGIKSRYFNRLTKEEITKDEFFRIKREYDTSFSFSYTEEQKLEIAGKRKSLVSKYKEYFESYSSGNKWSKEWIENIQKSKFPDFCEIFLHVKHYVVIGVVDADQELDIELDTTLSWLNYVSFSYDNKYVGIVGKPGNNGYLKLVKINYDETKKILSLEREICDTEIARWATWICAFTKNGLFGTYDSAPDLYLIKQSDFEKFNQDNANDFDFIRNHFQINDRSLLCFSPSGKLMALSNQGYEAKSLGGMGHVPSNDVYIYDTETRKMLSHWQDQGERIAFRNVANAGFSADESKLMTVSLDGVVVVRNIKEGIDEADNTSCVNPAKVGNRLSIIGKTIEP